MHIPDGFLSDTVNVTSAIVSIAALGVGVSQLKRGTLGHLAAVCSFIFAAQMLNFPIGGGTSGHFLGAALAAALMGPWAACFAMAVVLGVQGLAFADGGMTALGANILNMGVVGGLLSYPLMRALRTRMPSGQAGFLGAVGLASLASVVLASSACAIELAISGASPFGTVFPAMVGTHALIGIGEAAITIAALKLVMMARPQALPSWADVGAIKASASERQFAFGSLPVSLVLAMLISPFASGFPDGLEKVAQDKGFIELASEESNVWQASPFPDYQVAFVESEGPSTALAGLFGTLMVFGVAYGLRRSVKSSAQ